MWHEEREGLGEDLGEEFFKRMNEISERQHADWRPSSRYLRSAILACRYFWCLIGVFCQIDVYGGLQTYDDPKNIWKWKYRENFDRRFSSVSRVRWWPYVVFTLYSFCTSRMFINYYHQYVFDFSFMRLEVLKAMTAQNNSVDVSYQIRSNLESPYIRYISTVLAESNSHHETQPTITATNQLNELARYLEERVSSTRADLKSIGAPYINLHFVNEVVNNFTLSAGFILVVLITNYYKRFNPFDFSLTRAFLDLKHERRLQNRLIIAELNKFISSSLIFAQTCVAQLRFYAQEQPINRVVQTRLVAPGGRRATIQVKHSQSTLAKAATAVANKQQAKRWDSNKFLLDHILIKRQLKQMALNGMLLPVHRTAHWVDRTSIMTVMLDLLVMFYALVATLFFAFFFFALDDALDIELSTMDVFTIIEGGILLALIIPSSLFLISQIIANCVDQICYSLNICQQICKCITLNEQMFHLLTETEITIPNGRASDGLYGNLQSSGLKLASSSSTLDSIVSIASARSNSPINKIERKSLPLEHIESNIRTENVASDQRLANRSKTLFVELSDNLEKRPVELSRSLLAESCYTQMNSELLKTFMHYKIFKAQIKPLTRSFGTFASVCFLLATVVPINVRIHSSYLDQTTKLYSMSFNLLCLTIVDLCYIPLCYMYSRCLSLYTRLSSLLAHVIELQSDQQTRQVVTFRSSLRVSAQSQVLSGNPTSAFNGTIAGNETNGQVYDSHTVWLLRRELNHPDQLSNQFAIYAFSMRVSYSNLLRLHFWVGILTLSMVVDSASNQDFFGRLFNDPMGIFNWTPRDV